MCLPVPQATLMTDWSYVPAVSTASGKKMFDTDNLPCLPVLFAEALLAAAPGSLAV